MLELEKTFENLTMWLILQRAEQSPGAQDAEESRDGKSWRAED